MHATQHLGVQCVHCARPARGHCALHAPKTNSCTDASAWDTSSMSKRAASGPRKYHVGRPHAWMLGLGK